MFDNVPVPGQKRRAVVDLGLPEGVLRDLLEPIAARMEARAAQIAADIVSGQQPIVNVAGAQVHVPPAPAQVAPQVTLNVPDVLPPDVVIDVEALVREQRATNDLLRALADTLARPVVRDVQRDSGGRIVRVTETRGR